MRRIAFLLAFSLVVAACGDDADSVTADPTEPGSEPGTRPSVGGNWVLVGLTVDGEEVALLPDALEIAIADGQINGHGGCNSFFGAFDAADDGTLTLGTFAMTEMACVDGGRMEFESAYTQALSTATTWTVTPEGMVLSGEAAEIRYEQAPAPVNLPLEQTVWKFDTLYSGEGVDRAATNRADMEGVTLVIANGEAEIVGPDCSGVILAVDFDGAIEGAFRPGDAGPINSNPACEIVSLAQSGLNASTGFMIDENRLTFIGEAGETVGFSAS